MNQRSFRPAITRIENCETAFVDNAVSFPTGTFCNATWDGRLCWPPTLIGQTIKLKCPDYMNAGKARFAFRKCGIDGSWIGKDPWQKDNGSGWTNYSECGIFAITTTPGNKNVNGSLDPSLVDNKNGTIYNATVPASVVDGIFQTSCVSEDLQILQLTFLCLSLLFVVLSICLISCSKNYQQPAKVTFYIQLFAAFAFLDTIQLCNQLMAHVPQIKVLFGSAPVCQVLTSLRNFLDMATYWWLMMIALYFYSVLKGSRVNIRSCIIYSFVGWGIPAFLTILVIVISLFMNHKTCMCDEACEESEQIIQIWIKEGANIIALVMSYLLFSVAVFFRYKGDECERRKAKFLGKGMWYVICFDAIITLIYIMILIHRRGGSSSQWDYPSDSDTGTCFLVTVIFLRGLISSIVICLVEKIKCRACAPRKRIEEDTLAVFW